MSDEDAPTLTLEQVAARAGASAATIRRWVREGIVPGYQGSWTSAAAAQVRVVAQLRARGHTLSQIKQASENGELVVSTAGPIESLVSSSGRRYTLRQAARETGLKARVIERILTSMGLSALSMDALSEADVEMIGYSSQVLAAGFPLEAYLQLMRVYGQALTQIADAEVRLVHLHVHEPLMRRGVSGAKIAANMEGLTSRTLPLAAPLMNHLHGRFLAHFVEQDVVGHLETDIVGGDGEQGQMSVAIAFADLAGYARLTDERGDEKAVETVERFVEAVEQTLPVGARVIKTLGDEVMVVGADPGALTAWAVALKSQVDGGPDPRIGVHYGRALYREGDYYGRDVNQAARVVARAEGGEVLVTRPVVDVARGVDGLAFERIGKVGLKGFSELTELFAASRGE
ncbi:MAG TPA: adenylate cyclase regulatory domain-containing protein [Solirubrobacteraceae bacterium]|nr:adenylate cyclase regulatory domain-containing protein [Solirubrobacteraceae bacterium]